MAFAAVALVGGTCLLVDWLCRRETGESVASVYGLCGECGLSREETEELISTVRATDGSREKLLESFYATFKQRVDAEPCEPCAQAVLDAAGR